MTMQDLQYSQLGPNHCPVATRIVPKNEFEHIVKESAHQDNVLERTIYVVKPILVPVEALDHKPRNKTQR